MTMDTLVGVNYMTSDGGGTDLGVHSMDSHDLDHSQDVLSKILSTHTLRLSIVMLVAEKTLTSLKGQARSQISILRQGVCMSCVQDADAKHFYVKLTRFLILSG